MNHKKKLDVSQFHLNSLQNKTDALLYDIFPQMVADALREGTQPEPTLHPDVTILFTDIVTFTSMSATVDPAAVFEMLQVRYTRPPRREGRRTDCKNHKRPSTPGSMRSHCSTACTRWRPSATVTW